MGPKHFFFALLFKILGKVFFLEKLFKIKVAPCSEMWPVARQSCQKTTAAAGSGKNFRSHISRPRQRVSKYRGKYAIGSENRCRATTTTTPRLRTSRFKTSFQRSKPLNLVFGVWLEAQNCRHFNLNSYFVVIFCHT